MQFSKEGDEFFDRQPCLADDRAERTAIEFLVIGNGGLSGWRLAHDNDVAPTLSINFKANLAERLHTICTRDNGSVCSSSDLDQLNAIFRQRFATLLQNFFMQCDRLAHVVKSLFARSSLADATGETRNFGDNKTVFARI